MTVEVTFWGVRGSFPCASQDHQKYGGNTSCVTVECNGQVLILDAGTGLFMLGKSLMSRGICEATLLLSHAHLDHIMGFPFFAPVWNGAFSLTVMAGNLSSNGGVRAVFDQVLGDPVFPVPVQAMQGVTRFHDFRAGDAFPIGPNFSIRTLPLNHPNGATAYRIEAEGRSLCYVTDVEHTPGTIDPSIVELVRETNLFIYNSTYSDAEYEDKVGWGHSTWQQGTRIGKSADVERYAVFHHDPDHTDPVMDEIHTAVTALWDRSFVAREGMRIVL